MKLALFDFAARLFDMRRAEREMSEHVNERVKKPKRTKQKRDAIMKGSN